MSVESGLTEAPWLRDIPVVVAHRGASATHPENTLAAFEEALRVGVAFVEFDVRLTRDGAAVVHHDPDVSRTTDGTGAICDLTAAEVARLDAGAPGAPQRVPLLAEVLDLISGRAGVAVEIKNLPHEPGFTPDTEPIAEAVAHELRRTAFDGPVLVISFNPASIAAARALAPQVATGLLVPGRDDPTPAIALARTAGHDMILPGTWAFLPVGERFVSQAHGAGLRVGTWVVDDAPTVTRLVGWGLDAIASNDPAMAQAAVDAARR